MREKLTTASVWDDKKTLDCMLFYKLEPNLTGQSCWIGTMHIDMILKNTLWLKMLSTGKIIRKLKNSQI